MSDYNDGNIVDFGSYATTDDRGGGDYDTPHDLDPPASQAAVNNAIGQSNMAITTAAPAPVSPFTAFLNNIKPAVPYIALALAAYAVYRLVKE